jgi:hypothetical protein
MDLGIDGMVTVCPEVQAIAAMPGDNKPLFVELFHLGPQGWLSETTSTGHFSDMEFIVVQAEKPKGSLKTAALAFEAITPASNIDSPTLSFESLYLSFCSIPTFKSTHCPR